METAEATLRTVADYMQLPDDGRRYELIEGELLMAPAPNFYHQRVSFNLTLILGNFVERERLGNIFVTPFDVIFDEHNVLQPDIVYFSNSRSSAFTKAGASGAPDLVVEILSPGAEKHDRVLKRDVFARSGVKEFWLVQPNERRIVMHRLQANTDQSLETVESDGSFASSLLPGLTIHAADVFAE